MQLVEFYRLGELNTIAPNNDDPEVYVVTDDTLKAAMNGADTVIANIGLHYASHSEYQSRMMDYLQDIMVEEMRHRNVCCFWRSTLPQHFASTAGTGLYSDRIPSRTDCPPLRQTWKHPSDDVLQRVRTSSNIPLIDMTSLLEGASALHSLRVGDCSHYCYSSGLFAPILVLFGEAIRQAC